MKKSLCPAIALALNASAPAQSTDPKPSDLGKPAIEQVSIFGKKRTEIVQALGAMEKRLDQQNKKLKYAPVTNYASKVVRRQQLGRNIAIWSDAIDAALAETGGVYFPASDEAYYIDRPIILDSGMHIKADTGATIRLVADARVCMVRNRNLAVVRELAPGAVPPSGIRDHDISVTGGTWDHASSKRNDTDVREDAANPKIYIAWGNFLFLNVKDVSFTNLRIMRSPAFALLVSNGENLLFRDIIFEECFSDGVHIQGPTKNIVIKDIAGWTGDDFVSILSYRGETSEGPIDHLWIKGLRMEGGHRGMRLLASNGIVGDYPLTNVVIQDVTGTRDLKMSVFPNLQLLEPLRAANASADAGFMDWIFLENIAFLDSYVGCGYSKWNGCIQVHTNIGHLYLKNIRGGRPNITVGPVAQAKLADAAPGYTLKFDFPDLDCQVDEIVLEGFPEAERNSIVELVRGKQGVGKVKNLIFK